MTSPALLITRDELLLDDLLRLAAAAGTTLDVAHDARAALRAWAAALASCCVGADLAEALAAQRPAAARRRCTSSVTGRRATGCSAAALAVGAVDVVELPAADAWLVELLTDAADGVGPPGAGRRRGRRVGRRRRDHLRVRAGADRRGRGAGGAGRPRPARPGVDRVVGLDAARPGAGVRWDALVGSHGRLGSRSLRAALPVKDGLAVLDLGARTAGRPRRRARSARCSRRPGAATTWWSWTCRARSTTLGAEVVLALRPGAAGGRRRRSPGSPRPAGSPPAAPRSPGTSAWSCAGRRRRGPAEHVADILEPAAGRRGADPAPAGRARRPGSGAGARPARRPLCRAARVAARRPAGRPVA